ncbi:MAG: hypothetical protein WD733_21490 [Bryobacterales bacterium]
MEGRESAALRGLGRAPAPARISPAGRHAARHGAASLLVMARARLLGDGGGRNGKMERMVTLRCTRKLQKKLRASEVPEIGPLTTVLGDWYGDILFTRHARLLVFVSEQSRLAVLLHARDFPTLEERFRAGVVALLRHLGVSEEAIRREEAAMAEIVYAPTRNRSLLGTLNDYFRALPLMIEDRPTVTLTQYALRLSKTLCGPMNYERPRDVAMRLMSDWRMESFAPRVQ